ncbi:MAG TPA: 2OG-Fe(II) oxygenase [Chitinophagaceae bacterium]|nr:2OG-Fe(II) oxygenase [Chitinophagaceae bacterium]
MPIPEIICTDIKIEEAPFRHFYARNFFRNDFYELLVQEFEKVKETGLVEYIDKNKLSRFPGYDAYCWLLPPGCSYPLNIFYSYKWIDYFSALFGVTLTADVVAEFHHHKINSSSGFKHNDYNICCFVDDPLPNKVNPWYFQCSYDKKNNDMTSGRVTGRMRTIAIIYYLNNEPWKEGDGGETGLYANLGDAQPAVAIPPVSNAIMAFEISPVSWHAFITNTKNERNTIIMWLHADAEKQISRYGVKPQPFG